MIIGSVQDTRRTNISCHETRPSFFLDFSDAATFALVIAALFHYSGLPSYNLYACCRTDSRQMAFLASDPLVRLGTCTSSIPMVVLHCSRMVYAIRV